VLEICQLNQGNLRRICSNTSAQDGDHASADHSRQPTPFQFASVADTIWHHDAVFNDVGRGTIAIPHQLIEVRDVNQKHRWSSTMWRVFMGVLLEVVFWVSRESSLRLGEDLLVIQVVATRLEQNTVELEILLPQLGRREHCSDQGKPGEATIASGRSGLTGR